MASISDCCSRSAQPIWTESERIWSSVDTYLLILYCISWCSARSSARISCGVSTSASPGAVGGAVPSVLTRFSYQSRVSCRGFASSSSPPVTSARAVNGMVQAMRSPSRVKESSAASISGKT